MTDSVVEKNQSSRISYVRTKTFHKWIYSSKSRYNRDIECTYLTHQAAEEVHNLELVTVITQQVTYRDGKVE